MSCFVHVKGQRDGLHDEDHLSAADLVPVGRSRQKQLANEVEGHAGDRYGEACGGKIKAIFKIVIFFQITVVK